MHCLVVDPNVAFATLLKEELVRLGHTVDVCTSGTNALALVQSSPPDLALLDMGLQTPDALAVGHQLRALRHDVRLVLIPMMGEQPDLGTDAPTIQGVLPKPFFLPELPDRIASALGAPLDRTDPKLVPPSSQMDLPELASQQPDSAQDGASEVQVSTRVTSGTGATTPTAADDGDLADPVADKGSLAVEALFEGSSEGALDWLAALEPLDANAEAGEPRSSVLGDVDALAQGESGVGVGPATIAPPTTSQPSQGISRRAFRMNQGRIEALMHELVAEVGADGVILTCDTGLLTAVGGLDEREIESISAAVLSGSRTSAEMARILGREQLRFEQSIAGGSYLLYALGIQDAILAVTVSGDAPLGLLRHRARATAERIADLCT